jgi:soluble lytic murein transglycosylase
VTTRTATDAGARRRAPAPAAARRLALDKRRAKVRRRRIGALLLVALLAIGVALALKPLFHDAVRQIALPLRHADIIRQQSRDKDVDPALVAAVIYAESHFIDGRTSSAGAQGLMQLTPDTAQYIARKSGGTQFHVSDLGTPQVNIAYGTFYLNYLIKRYGDDIPLVLAAYNAGEGNVDKWIAQARASDQALDIGAIPFGETRSYVAKVLEARREYRASYKRELGL